MSTSAPVASAPARKQPSTRLLEGRELFEIRGSHIEAARGALGHDVGRLAPVGDDAVNALALGDVLPQRGDGLIGDHQPIQRVDAALGHRGGVRRSDLR